MRRNLLLFEGENHFDETADARGGFKMADICFDGADPAHLFIRITVTANCFAREYFFQRVDFDRIAQ